MRTFEQYQLQKPLLSGFARSSTAILGPNYHTMPVAYWQRIIGNQAVQRLLQARPEARKTALNDIAPAFGKRNLSRIAPYPSVAALQPSSATDKPVGKNGQGTDRIFVDHILVAPGNADQAACSTGKPLESAPRNDLEQPLAYDLDTEFERPIAQTSPALQNTPMIQCKSADVQEANNHPPQREADKNAELEFHSTVAFNSATSGYHPSSPPSEEGFSSILIRWAVWNTGWKTAPEHVDRLTIYKADRCSGCRDNKDEILSTDVTVPPIVSITQPGEGKSEYEGINNMIGMTLQAGHYDVYVDLDVFDEVEEINKDNNTAFMTFYVKPSNKSEPETE